MRTRRRQLRSGRWCSCKRLPLSLALAGKLAQDMGLGVGSNWSILEEALEEEFRQGGQMPEQTVIAASLRGIRGRHRAEILALFKAMALISEDVCVNCEVLAMMYDAEVGTAADGASPTVLNLRRWLKTLQDRSLVLGTVDKPSLHDIPRDFVNGQHSVEELRQAHHRMVEIVRRPSKPYAAAEQWAWVGAFS